MVENVITVSIFAITYLFYHDCKAKTLRYPNHIERLSKLTTNLHLFGKTVTNDFHLDLYLSCPGH